MLITDTILRNEKDIGVNWEIARTTDDSLFSVAQNLIDTTGGGGTLTYRLLRGKWTTDDFVRVLEEVEDVRVLASPRILVLSGREANIETIDELPYQQLTQTAEGGQIGTTAFKEVGVKLRVTPRITEEKRIILRISAEESAVAGESIDEIPVVSTRKAETTLVLNDGETVIIGGLRRKTNIKTIRQVPILGNIPLLGFLFRYTATSIENRDLVIFITPHLFTQSVLSREDREALSAMGSLRKRPPELEERIHGMAKDVQEGNVDNIRSRLRDLRRRLYGN